MCDVLISYTSQKHHNSFIVRYFLGVNKALRLLSVRAGLMNLCGGGDLSEKMKVCEQICMINAEKKERNRVDQDKSKRNKKRKGFHERRKIFTSLVVVDEEFLQLLW